MNVKLRDVTTAAVFVFAGVAVVLPAYLVGAYHNALTSSEEKPAATTQATPATWPCPLPIAEGERSVAIVEKHGAVFDVICRDIQLLIKPIASKGAQ